MSPRTGKASKASKAGKSGQSVAEELFLEKLRETDLPMPEAEVRLWDDRKHRVDFVWIQYELVVEIEGGSYVHGRHHRPRGFEADCEKYNRIASEGLCLFRFTPAMIRSGLAMATVQEYFRRWCAIDHSEALEATEATEATDQDQQDQQDQQQSIRPEETSR